MATQHQSIHSILANLSCNVSSFPWAMTCRWPSTRVRDLLDSLYRSSPSGAILLWETDEVVPQQEFAVAQQHKPYHSHASCLTANNVLPHLRQ
jgi:hypothetical protein